MYADHVNVVGGILVGQTFLSAACGGTPSHDSSHSFPPPSTASEGRQECPPHQCKSHHFEVAAYYRSLRASVLEDSAEVLAIIALARLIGEAAKLCRIDKSRGKRDLFDTCHFQSLAFFKPLHEHRAGKQ